MKNTIIALVFIPSIFLFSLFNKVNAQCNENSGDVLITNVPQCVGGFYLLTITGKYDGLYQQITSWDGRISGGNVGGGGQTPFLLAATPGDEIDFYFSSLCYTTVLIDGQYVKQVSGSIDTTKHISLPINPCSAPNWTYKSHTDCTAYESYDGTITVQATTASCDGYRIFVSDEGQIYNKFPNLYGSGHPVGPWVPSGNSFTIDNIPPGTYQVWLESYDLHKNTCQTNRETITIIEPPCSITFNFYVDNDGDGYGTGTTVRVCAVDAATPPFGYSVNNLDCNDSDNTKHTAYDFYADNDGDGYGTGTVVSVCAVDAATPPSGYSVNNSDCNDSDNTKHAAYDFYADNDGDGYGAGTAVSVCAVDATTPTSGYSVNNSDCNDSDNTKHASFDFYADNDGDGYGAGTAVRVCAVDATTPPSGLSVNNSDCNDSDNTKHATYDFYADNDGDGYGAGTAVRVCAVDAATPPSGYSVYNTDCNNNNVSVHPGANEVCNGIDDNCVGQIDEGCNSLPTLSINDVTVYESEGKAILTVSLSKKSNVALKISYATKDGTAVSIGKNKDYIKTTGNLSIPAGALTATIQIPIINDNIAETPEDFDVLFSKYKDVMILDVTGTVTIFNGSPAARVEQIDELSSNEFTVVIYPNPSKNSFNLNVTSSNIEPVKVSVFNMVGRPIYTAESAVDNNLQFGEKFPIGIYLIDVQQGKTRVLEKVIKNE